MNKKLIIGFVIVLVVAVVGFIAFKSVDEFSKGGGFRALDGEKISSLSEKEEGDLPDCGAVLYTESFVEISKINEITPLGNTEPPGHTIPTNHVYIHLFNQGEQTTTLPLIAPADIWITEIISSQGYLDPEDYSIRFAVCKDVMGYFNHVKALSPEMQAILDSNKCRGFSGESGSDRCEIKVFEPIKSGIRLGEVGRLQGNFDFGTYDFRTTHDFINPERYGDRTLQIECGFDYYIEELKNDFVSLFPSEAEGSCGKTNYDILGTLQGNWFNGDANEFSPETWNQHLYIGYDNENPNLAVFSIGGVFVDEPTKWLFTPKESGIVNLAPEEVKIGETIYCYERTQDAPDYRYRGFETGKILVKLLTDNEIKIEYQSGSCTTPEFTDNAVNYQR